MTNEQITEQPTVRVYIASPANANVFANPAFHKDVSVGDVYLRRGDIQSVFRPYSTGVMGVDLLKMLGIGPTINHLDYRIGFEVPRIVTKRLEDGFEYSPIDDFLEGTTKRGRIEEDDELYGLLLHHKGDGKFEVFMDPHLFMYLKTQTPRK